MTHDELAEYPARRRRPRWRHIVLIMAALGVVSIGMPTAWAYGSSKGRIVGSATEAPHHDATVVMGAGVRPDGQPSQLLAGRLDVAADLYHSGRTTTIIVSGTVDPTSSYHEPRTMRDYLVDAGVPGDVITLDEEGEDTRATCERARDAFGLETFLIVSQQFHLPRAVAVCRGLGLDVVGVAHDSSAVNPPGTRTGYAREVAASIPAMWESLLR